MKPVSDSPSSPRSPTLAQRRRRIGHLIGSQPLSARSVLASVILGADEPRLPVANLIAAASLFGISPGAARTCLWRMVASGELTSEGASYALAGRLLERRHRVDDAAHPDPATRRWDGTWELAVVRLDRRPAADRLELRRAAAALHLAEIKEGVWMRPDNLDPDRLPGSRGVLDRQCAHFRGARSEIAPDTVKSLFSLDVWSRDATRLTRAMEDELAAESTDPDMGGLLSHRFALAIAVVRHLQLDPVLPSELLPDDWSAADLRLTFRRFDDGFKRQLRGALRQPSR